VSSPTLRFKEVMSGRAGFGASSYQAGNAGGNSLRIEARIAIDDVDRFIADPAHRATVRGNVLLPALGSPAAIEHGWFELFPDAESGAGRMLYRLWFRDAAGNPLTLRGYKRVGNDPGWDAWRDTTTLYVRLLSGHVGGREDEVTGPDRAATLALGIVRITLPAFLRQLTTFRSTGGSRVQELFAVMRFYALFAGQLWRWYVPRPFPDEVSVSAPRPGTLSHPPDPPGVDRDCVPFEARDGMECFLTRVRPPNPTKGPVLLIAGTSVPANVFEAPDGETIVQRLAKEGYDVFMETWRGSASEQRNQFTLEEAAVHDHVAAVAKVLELAGAEQLKAVVHCQGSTSFMMALVCGLLPEVTHVVSNSVSLHPVVPPRSEVKLRLVGPVVAWLSDYLNPQAGRWTWGLRDLVGRRPLAAARTLALMSLLRTWVALTHHECHSMVCKFSSFIYGEGESVMWSHANITPKTHSWLADEFFWVPTLFFRQIGRSTMARRLVPLRTLDAVRGLTELHAPPATRAKITFMTGLDNRCFAPESQLLSYRYMTAWQPRQHRLVELPGYGHLDVWFSKRSAADVFPAVVEGLDR
jgi:hypothetical protein